VSAQGARPGAARRACLAVTAALLAAILAGAASAGAQSLRIVEGGGATFPARSLVLSVPGRGSLRASEIHLAENGKSIGSKRVRPIANAAAGDFGVVLAIDVSPSMRGQPLAKAMAAARALAAQRTGNQELGIVTFDRSATVTLPLTTDSRAISFELAHSPAVGQGAYIYNALTSSVQQLANAKIAAGAVILLSDGASQGAKPQPGHNLTANSVGAAAAAAHAQIYTVGLRDSSYTPGRMTLLARVGGGAFIESTSSQLARVFTQIESGLTSRYVLHYRSHAQLGQSVAVSVNVDGVPETATLDYTTPAPAVRAGTAPSKGKSFWVSSTALIVLSATAAFLVGLGFAVVLFARLRRAGLRERVGAFTAGGATVPETEQGGGGSSLIARLERSLERMRWWPNFKLNVEIARFEHSAVELVALTAVGTIVVAILAGIALRTPVLSILVLLIGPLALHAVVKQRVAKQRELFADQLPSHLQELASTMRTGHSLVSGITSVAGSAPEPSHTEWGRVVADERLGVPLDEAMRPMAERMESDDVGQVTLVAALHQSTGGNMAEVLERVADSVRERSDLRRELRSLTAQARLSRYVVTALPPVVVGLVALISPKYMRPLFDTSLGVILIFIAFGLLVTASLVMRKITDVDV
jgi:tight adherence protein B